MSDVIHPGRRALDDWRLAQAAGRQVASRRLDGWVEAWGCLLLLATILYTLIGHTPYDHELVFDPLTGGALMSPINRYFWLGLLACAAPILVLRSRDLPRAARRLWPLLALFGWFVISTSWAIDHDASVRRLFLYCVGLLICLAIRLAVPEGRRLHQVLAWACAIVIIIDLGSWIIMPAKSMTDLGLAAIHNHKNTLGAVMLFSAMVITPYLVGQTRTLGRLGWSAALLGCFVLLIASRSKTSLGITVFAALLGPLIIVAMSLRGRLLWSLTAAAGALLAAALFGWLAWSACQGADPLDPITRLTFTHRTDVWRFVYGEFAHRPLQGVGFGSFWDVDPQVQPSLKTDEWFAKPDAPTNEAHNGYLDIAATVGLPGLIGALYLLGRWIAGGLGRIRDALMSARPQARADLPLALFLGLFPLVFFVHNWMESSYFTADSTFGLIILLVGIEIDLTQRG